MTKRKVFETVSNSSMPKERNKKRKMKKEILRPCSKQKLELKTGGEEVTRECEEFPREILQSTWNEMKKEDTMHNLPGIPQAPSNQIIKPKVIFVLERASLVPALVGKKRKILDSEEEADANFLLKQKKNLDDYRPNIVFKAVRKILDSPLNTAGMIGAVYVKIEQGLLFEIKPHVRIPRTLDRFCGIMLELLQKSCIRTKDTGEILIRAIEEPVTRHLPVNSRIVGVSHASEKVVDINDYVSSATDDLNLVFVVGTMVDGKINKEYLDDFISVSNYPLLPRFSLGAICHALERKWKLF